MLISKRTKIVLTNCIQLNTLKCVHIYNEKAEKAGRRLCGPVKPSANRNLRTPQEPDDKHLVSFPTINVVRETHENRSWQKEIEKMIWIKDGNPREKKVGSDEQDTLRGWNSHLAELTRLLLPPLHSMSHSVVHMVKTSILYLWYSRNTIPSRSR